MSKLVSKSDRLFTGLGLLGVSTIVLPFACDESPLSVIGVADHELAFVSPWQIGTRLTLATIRVYLAQEMLTAVHGTPGRPAQRAGTERSATTGVAQ